MVLILRIYLYLKFKDGRVRLFSYYDNWLFFKRIVRYESILVIITFLDLQYNNKDLNLRLDLSLQGVNDTAE